jgi:catalase
MTDIDREHLIGNIVSHLRNASKEILLRQTQIFYNSDPEYGQRVAEGLSITLTKAMKNPVWTPLLTP